MRHDEDYLVVQEHAHCRLSVGRVHGLMREGRREHLIDEQLHTINIDVRQDEGTQFAIGELARLRIASAHE